MSLADPFWGAPRIHGELLKLGVDVGQTSVAKYMAPRRRPPSQGWRTFLLNHADGIASDRPVRGSDDLISAAIRIARSWTRPAANYVAWRHRASHCRMDRSPNHGGLRLGGSADLSGSRSGPRLRRGIYPTHSSDGHSRQTDSAAISLAERLCGTTDRLDQTRMPGSRDHN